MSIGTNPVKETEPQPSSAKIQISGSENPIELYRPDETPLFKKLVKTRLTKTRTKQLLRAAEREFDDPPPPPGLGDCCGSSCDPCVRDLWKEEIGVWRERWGDWAMEEKKEDMKEDRKEDGKKDTVKTEGRNGVKSTGVKRSIQKELEW